MKQVWLLCTILFTSIVVDKSKLYVNAKSLKKIVSWYSQIRSKGNPRHIFIQDEEKENERGTTINSKMVRSTDIVNDIRGYPNENLEKNTDNFISHKNYQKNTKESLKNKIRTMKVQESLEKNNKPKNHYVQYNDDKNGDERKEKMGKGEEKMARVNSAQDRYINWDENYNKNKDTTNFSNLKTSANKFFCNSGSPKDFNSSNMKYIDSKYGGLCVLNNKNDSSLTNDKFINNFYTKNYRNQFDSNVKNKSSEIDLKFSFNEPKSEEIFSKNLPYHVDDSGKSMPGEKVLPIDVKNNKKTNELHNKQNVFAQNGQKYRKDPLMEWSEKVFPKIILNIDQNNSSNHSTRIRRCNINLTGIDFNNIIQNFIHNTNQSKNIQSEDTSKYSIINESHLNNEKNHVENLKNESKFFFKPSSNVHETKNRSIKSTRKHYKDEYDSHKPINLSDIGNQMLYLQRQKIKDDVTDAKILDIIRSFLDTSEYGDYQDSHNLTHRKLLKENLQNLSSRKNLIPSNLYSNNGLESIADNICEDHVIKCKHSKKYKKWKKKQNQYSTEENQDVYGYVLPSCYNRMSDRGKLNNSDRELNNISPLTKISDQLLANFLPNSTHYSSDLCKNIDRFFKERKKNCVPNINAALIDNENDEDRIVLRKYYEKIDERKRNDVTNKKLVGANRFDEKESLPANNGEYKNKLLDLLSSLILPEHKTNNAEALEKIRSKDGKSQIFQNDLVKLDDSKILSKNMNPVNEKSSFLVNNQPKFYREHINKIPSMNNSHFDFGFTYGFEKFSLHRKTPDVCARVIPGKKKKLKSSQQKVQVFREHVNKNVTKPIQQEYDLGSTYASKKSLLRKNNTTKSPVNIVKVDTVKKYPQSHEKLLKFPMCREHVDNDLSILNKEKSIFHNYLSSTSDKNMPVDFTNSLQNNLCNI